MSHKPISFNNIALSFPQKICFEGFSTQIHPGDRIAIIGQNGSGKTTLLKMLQGLVEPMEGSLYVPNDICFGYVPQVVEDFNTLSRGQRFHKALTQAFSLNPDVLLLDEPTNHLDMKNRESLMRILQSYPGTLIIVSHDVGVLRRSVSMLWHIQGRKIHVFSGHYEDYRREIDIKRTSLEQELSQLDRQKKKTHEALMKEQTRAKNSRLRGEKHIEQRKWPMMTSAAKMRRTVTTPGANKMALRATREHLGELLEQLQLPEVLTPKFSLEGSDVGSKTLVSIQNGGIGYDNPLLKDIHLSIASQERWGSRGDNGSGKTTLVKAILGDPQVKRTGHWLVPDNVDIGYLDQHYRTLDSRKTVLETINALVLGYSHAELRSHLNDFLFRKNEEVNALVSSLSGGEKARLTLAQIASKTPKLLILDEITNNLDLETRDHVTQVLKNYPGAMIVISHDENFLRDISINNFYVIRPPKDQ